MADPWTINAQTIANQQSDASRLQDLAFRAGLLGWQQEGQQQLQLLRNAGQLSSDQYALMTAALGNVDKLTNAFGSQGAAPFLSIPGIEGINTNGFTPTPYASVADALRLAAERAGITKTVGEAQSNFEKAGQRVDTTPLLQPVGTRVTDQLPLAQFEQIQHPPPAGRAEPRPYVVNGYDANNQPYQMHLTEGEFRTWQQQGSGNGVPRQPGGETLTGQRLETPEVGKLREGLSRVAGAEVVGNVVSTQNGPTQRFRLNGKLYDAYVAPDGTLKYQEAK